MTQNACDFADPVDVANGGSGLAATTAFAVLCGGTTTTAPLQSIASVGTAAQILTSNGAGALPTFQAAAGGGGKILQVVNTTYLTYTSVTTTIPFDDTIPQNTEGTEIFTLAITPDNASNFLLIMCTFMMGTASAATFRTSALFQDSDANALACTCTAGTSIPMTTVFNHYMTAGTDSATTFKIRIGEGASGTVFTNGSSSNRIYGGVSQCAMTIMEIEV